VPRKLISQEIESLRDQDVATLRRNWTAHFGTDPPIWISRQLLIQALGYRLQERALGGLKTSIQRKLVRLAAEFQSTGSISMAASAGFKPGTKLIREWRGKVHEIEVLTDGFAWSGRRYRTLSEIARAITGTRWSGPRFFGLEPAKSSSVAKPGVGNGKSTQPN
jgi:hypothetical protein